MRVFLSRITRRNLLKASAAGAGLAACGCFGNSRVSAQGGSWKITLIQGVTADEFYISMACGAQRAADEAGAQLNVQAGEKWDHTIQTSLLNAVVQAKPDAILIAPNDRTAMIAPIQAAIDAGIAVFTVDTKIEADIALANIASDNVEGGRIAARALAELIGNKGKVYVQNTVAGTSTTDQRVQGFEEGIKEFPDIEYVGLDFNNDDPTTAASQTAAKLQQHPDLAGIFGTNLFSAEGAATAVREAGKQGQIKIVGFDAGPKQVADLRNEIVDVLIAQHPYDIGYTAVKMAADYLNTKTAPTEKVVTTGYSVVTRDNVEDPEIKTYLYVADCSEIPAATPSPAAQ
ncbi:MAG: ribose transport system substrate-binding protein [Thermomicrobiales bacterium]|jgi:ribose transport system substrate-binding protein|nr:ribose transport system substrate-binding protein [Thermomicrobiales bacterium]MEA2527073.1 ribose transport system substrate-binding protein [Thermomicrobiales bacterium]MEA2593645.1 ribose transport system substrate-binding protein [Thermomicrobiales bacterium]